MKIILGFVFLVIAAQALTPAYYLGFNEQLGFNNEQMKHGSACFETFEKVMMDMHYLVRSKSTSEILRSAIILIEDVEHKLKADCSAYLNEVNIALFRNYKKGDFTVKRNWSLYAPEIIQQIAMYVDAMRSGHSYEAGKTEAYIYQVLLGLEQPKVLPHVKSSWEKHVHVDYATGVKEMLTGFYESFGLYGDKGIQDTINCEFALDRVNSKLINFNFELTSAKTSSERLLVKEKLIQVMFELHDACIDAVNFNLQNLVLPILGAWEVAPVHATLALIHNYAISLPEMIQLTHQLYADMNEGRRYEAGNLLATLLTTWFSNTYPDGY